MKNELYTTSTGQTTHQDLGSVLAQIALRLAVSDFFRNLRREAKILFQSQPNRHISSRFVPVTILGRQSDTFSEENVTR